MTVTPLNASTAASAVFAVTSAIAGTTCTATEIVPVGYTANQAACEAMALVGGCTIINTLNLSPAAIPTLSEWAMVLLTALFAFADFAALRKQAS